MAGARYGKYVVKEPKGQPMQPRVTRIQSISLTGANYGSIATLNMDFNFVGIVGPHVMGDPSHKHNVDELLFFIPKDPASGADLGGVVEVALGEEWEKQTINTPAIICLPAGVQHGPLNVKKVTTPFYFGHCLLAPKYASSETPAV